MLMSRAGKAIQRLLSSPKDFTWQELKTIMESFGYELKTGDGSARKFIHPVSKVTLMLHEPHPSGILKVYQVRAAVKLLKQEKHV